MMGISSCKDCVAPKRYPGCHSVCQEYLEQKVEHDRLKAIHDREHRVTVDIYTSRNEKIYQAMKDRRNKKV